MINQFPCPGCSVGQTQGCIVALLPTPIAQKGMEVQQRFLYQKHGGCLRNHGINQNLLVYYINIVTPGLRATCSVSGLEQKTAKRRIMKEASYFACLKRQNSIFFSLNVNIASERLQWCVTRHSHCKLNEDRLSYCMHLLGFKMYESIFSYPQKIQRVSATGYLKTYFSHTLQQSLD